jgi:hypothetical protein
VQKVLVSSDDEMVDLVETAAGPLFVVRLLFDSVKALVVEFVVLETLLHSHRCHHLLGG